MDGKNITRYINGVSGDDLNYPSSGFYISDKDGSGGFIPDIYYSTPLVGGSVGFNVYFSLEGCTNNCNIGLYFVSWPRYNWNRNRDPSRSNNYYCFAN